MDIKTSGNKQEFGTGAHRDSQKNKGRFDLIPIIALRRLAKHYENGANLYGEDNWRQGIPLKRLLDSAMRHLLQCLEGKEDEDHAAAVLWNICGFMYTKDAIDNGLLPKELDNLYHSEEPNRKTKETKNNSCYPYHILDEYGNIFTGDNENCSNCCSSKCGCENNTTDKHSIEEYNFLGRTISSKSNFVKNLADKIQNNDECEDIGKCDKHTWNLEKKDKAIQDALDGVAPILGVSDIIGPIIKEKINEAPKRREEIIKYLSNVLENIKSYKNS